MDNRTKQAIKDMRFDLAKLEIQLSRTKKNDYFTLSEDEAFCKRAVLEDQILELRLRLKAMLEMEEERKV